MLGWTQAPPAGESVNPSGGLIRLVEAAMRLDPRTSVTLKSCALGGGEATVTVRHA